MASKSRARFIRFYREARDIREEIERGIERNIQDASAVMVERAKQATPPNHGEKRGVNTVTGNLASHVVVMVILSFQSLPPKRYWVNSVSGLIRMDMWTQQGLPQTRLKALLAE